MCQIIWDEGDEGIIHHVEEHGLTIEDVEHVLQFPEREGVSHSSGLPIVFGYTPSAEYIIVVYEEYDDEDPPAIRPITAYPVREPRE